MQTSLKLKSGVVHYWDSNHALRSAPFAGRVTKGKHKGTVEVMDHDGKKRRVYRVKRIDWQN